MQGDGSDMNSVGTGSPPERCCRFYAASESGGRGEVQDGDLFIGIGFAEVLGGFYSSYSFFFSTPTSSGIMTLFRARNDMLLSRNGR